MLSVCSLTESLLSFPIGPLGEGCKKWGWVVLPGAGHTHLGQKSHRTPVFSSPQEALLLVVVPHQHVAAECRGRDSAAPPCSSAGLSSIFSSQFYPKCSQTPTFCGSCALFQHSHQLYKQESALCGGHLSPLARTSSSPHQWCPLSSTRGFTSSMPQGTAAPAPGTPHRGSSHPIPSQEGTGMDHSTSSPRPLGVPIPSRLMAGPPASAGPRPGGFSLARSNDKGPLVKAGFASSYVSTAFSLFTEYSDM